MNTKIFNVVLLLAAFTFAPWAVSAKSVSSPRLRYEEHCVSALMKAPKRLAKDAAKSICKCVVDNVSTKVTNEAYFEDLIAPQKSRLKQDTLDALLDFEESVSAYCVKDSKYKVQP